MMNKYSFMHPSTERKLNAAMRDCVHNGKQSVSIKNARGAHFVEVCYTRGKGFTFRCDATGKDYTAIVLAALREFKGEVLTKPDVQVVFGTGSKVLSVDNTKRLHCHNGMVMA